MKVYIAGPYSNGDVAQNVRVAIHIADAIVARGHIPYVPHLTHEWHFLSPKSYEWWLAYDMEWLLACDALSAHSRRQFSADQEVKRAEAEGIPVFTSVDDLP